MIVIFAVSGIALPLTGYLHTAGGFPLVLGLAFLFGLGLFLGTLITWRYMQKPAAIAA